MLSSISSLYIYISVVELRPSASALWRICENKLTKTSTKEEREKWRERTDTHRASVPYWSMVYFYVRVLPYRTQECESALHLRLTMSAVSVLDSLSSFWNLRRYWPESMEEASTKVRVMVASQYDVFFISIMIFSLASQVSLSFVLRNKGPW